MTEYIELIKSLFTEQQQIALGIMTLAVMAAIQGYKHTWLVFYPEKRPLIKRAKIWTFAIVTGLIFSMIAPFIVDEKLPPWFWAFTGICSGVGAITVFKTVIEGPAKISELLRKSK